MKTKTMFTSLFFLLAASVGVAMIGKPAPAEDRAGSKPATAKDDAVTTPAARLRHVVFFKFKAGTTPEKLKEITDAFAELPTKIDAIRDFEWGTDVSVENLSKGFTHCFFVTFDDEKGRDAYLPHPAHKAFVDIVKPCLEDVCVVDYRETRPKPATAKESK